MSAAGFFSYVRFDDQTEEGQITEFCKRLENEVTQRLGEPFKLFQDTHDIKWGQGWQRRLDEGLGASTLFIPVITPLYLKREACRKELATFLAKEQELKRDDLVLPLLYIETPAITDPTRLSQDPLAQAIVDHQFRDWRDLRREPWHVDKLKRLDHLAADIVKALERAQLSGIEMKGEKGPVKATAASSLEPLQALESMAPSGSQSLQSFKEPVTFIVHPEPGWGDYTTIGAAIAAARGGERILIRPHHYFEALVIDKTLELIGEGNRDEIVIEANGAHGIDFRTTFGSAANLTIRQTSSSKYHGVNFPQGQITLQDCDITSLGVACVGIHHGANPIVLRNRIHGGKDCGVLVYANGKGTIEDNEIYGNALAGVAVQTGGSPTVRRNRIYDGKQVGVYVGERGMGIFEENDIYGNAHPGVAIVKGGDPIFRRNRIHNGKQNGILVAENGKGLMEDNDLYANGYPDVAIKTGGNPTLRRNRIHNGKQNAVHVYDYGKGLLEDNEIYASHYPAVVVKGGGDSILRGNRIYNGNATGILIVEGGHGTFEENNIYGHALAGVEVSESSAFSLKNNIIRDNGSEAIWVHNQGGGTYEENDLRGNKLGAWKIDDSSRDKVIRRDNIEDMGQLE